MRLQDPSPDARLRVLTEIPEDLRYSLTNAAGKDSYPISGTVWAVLYVKQPPGKGQAVVDFLRWITHEGQPYAPETAWDVTLPSGYTVKSVRVERTGAVATSELNGQLMIHAR